MDSLAVLRWLSPPIPAPPSSTSRRSPPIRAGFKSMWARCTEGWLGPSSLRESRGSSAAQAPAAPLHSIVPPQPPLNPSHPPLNLSQPHPPLNFQLTHTLKRRWEKRTELELGPSGFRKLLTTLRGWTAEGEVAWEESWWEASDWVGLRELGALKTGSTPTGGCAPPRWVCCACSVRELGAPTTRLGSPPRTKVPPRDEAPADLGLRAHGMLCLAHVISM